MVPKNVATAAETYRLFPINLPPAPPDMKVIPMGGEKSTIPVLSDLMMVGRLYPVGPNKYVAVPTNFPAKVGTAEECLGFLARYRDCQTFPVVVRFSEGQMCIHEKNEDIVSVAMEKVSRKMVGLGHAVGVSVFGCPPVLQEGEV